MKDGKRKLYDQAERSEPVIIGMDVGTEPAKTVLITGVGGLGSKIAKRLLIEQALTVIALEDDRRNENLVEIKLGHKCDMPPIILDEPVNNKNYFRKFENRKRGKGRKGRKC